MSKTSTKRALNRNHNPNSTGTNQPHSRQAAAVAAAEAKKRASLRNTSSGRLGKKTRKKLSHQQATEVRDTLNAEFRDLRTGTIGAVQQSLQLPDGTAFSPAPPKTTSEAAGFDPLAQQLPEQSVQDLAGILSTL